MAAAVETFPSALQENVANLSYLLQKGIITELPRCFVWEDVMKTNIRTSNAQEAADECNGKLSLPVIDISALRASHEDPAAVQKVLNELGEAAENYGFCQVVNHGIPEELMTEVQIQGHKFFSLPVEVKEKSNVLSGIKANVTGYNGKMDFTSNTPWTETLTARRTEVEPLTKRVWPEGNPAMSQPMEKFWTMLENLGWQLIEALAKHAGVDASTLKHYTPHQPAEVPDEPRFTAAWRLCHYPACPQADQTLGLGPHADPGFLTLLHQDDVGGLQVRKGDKWIDVTPMPGALCINVGDALEVWTNGRFKSIEHRVCVKEKVSRMSAVYFIVPGRDQKIEISPQLIDDEHPALYRPYVYGDYVANIYKCRLIGKSSLELVRKPMGVA